MGQLPSGSITLAETIEDVEKFTPRDANKLAYVTQTTLSVDDTAAMVDRLKQRFPDIAGPHKEDISTRPERRMRGPLSDRRCDDRRRCTNRRTPQRLGKWPVVPRAVLMQRAADIRWSDFDGVSRLSGTAGAAAPEVSRGNPGASPSATNSISRPSRRRRKGVLSASARCGARGGGGRYMAVYTGVRREDLTRLSAMTSRRAVAYKGQIAEGVENSISGAHGHRHSSSPFMKNASPRAICRFFWG
jgi:hypothetical protein